MEEVFEHGGNIHKFLRENTRETVNCFDFSANINPLGLSQSVSSSIKDTIHSIIHYPDVDGYELKNTISQYYHTSYDCLTLGNGAVELLYILCNLIQPKNALILAPSFSEYERAARAAKAKIEYYYLKEHENFNLNIKDFILTLEKNDVLFIGNPNNPTGTILTSKDIEKIVYHAKKNNCFVVVDESFIDFLPDSEKYTARHLVEKFDNLLVLHSLTKFYAIPGLRLGFAMTNSNLTKSLHQVKDPWNVNVLAQTAGVAALKDLKYQENSRAFMVQELEFFYENLKNLTNIKVYKPTVNFILANIEKSTLKAAKLKSILLNENILIRDCTNYPGLSEYYVRFAIKQHNENIFLIETLKKALMDGK